MHVEFSNFEIRRIIVLQKYGVIVRRNNTHQIRTSPLVRVLLFQKLGG